MTTKSHKLQNISITTGAEIIENVPFHSCAGLSMQTLSNHISTSLANYFFPSTPRNRSITSGVCWCLCVTRCKEGRVIWQASNNSLASPARTNQTPNSIPFMPDANSKLPPNERGRRRAPADSISTSANNSSIYDE